MAINWNKWFPRDNERLMWATIFSFIGACLLVFFYFNKEKIKSKEDLMFVSGAFEKYRWTSYGGRGGSTLTFKLQNYPSYFQVKADFYSILDVTGFKSIHHGEMIMVEISKVDAHLLNTQRGSIPAYGITSGNTTYLNADEAIEKHNSPLSLCAAGILLLLGFTFMYFIPRAKVKTSNSHPD